MDISTIREACRQNYFKKRYKGEPFYDRPSKPDFHKLNIGDFFIVNTDSEHGGAHWFTLMKGSDMWLIFDCSDSTPLYIYKHILSKSGHPYIVDRMKLEGTYSLLCGEFAIMAASLMTNILTEFGNRLNFKNYPNLFYSKHIIRYINSFHESADKFAFQYVYKSMKKQFCIHPEREKEVKSWLESYV